MGENGVAIPAVTAHGAVIPKIGLGTWQLRGEQCARIVTEALRVGYTHIDTAQGYANEAAVGDGLAASGIDRGGVFITTKVQPQYMGNGDLQRSVEESLRKLRIDHIDLLLLHWPNPEIPLADSIRALNQVKREGLVRHVGLSNFTSLMLDNAWRLTTEPLAAEQIEYHPFLDQKTMRAALKARGMATVAYCPIALGRVVGDPTIESIARAHGKSAAQVTLRWLVQQPDVVAIPKTAKAERLPENLAVFDFALTDAEMARMSALTRPDARLVNEPQWVAEWD
jgi:diketogulonate reductase-like aldo/keto reductase